MSDARKDAPSIVPITEGLEHISIDTVRDKLGEVVNEVFYLDRRVVVTRYGAPAAVLISIASFGRLRELEASEPPLDRASGE